MSRDVYEDTRNLPVNDIWQAAYLVAIGLPVLSVDVQVRMVTMWFPNKDGRAAEEASKFLNGNPPAPARSLLHAWKKVNWLVRQARQAGVA